MTARPGGEAEAAHPGHTEEPALVEEHEALLHEVQVRCQAVVQALGDGRWPAAEITRLVDYLRYELLDQTVNEERLLYPLISPRWSDPRIQRLISEHVALREVTNGLATLAPDQLSRAGDQAAGVADDPARVIDLIDELRAALRTHLQGEQETLGAVGDRGVTPLRRPFRSHGWFPLTEGPVVDVDELAGRLPPEELVERITHLHPGGRLELLSGAPLETLERLFLRRGLTTEYGWGYLEEGPHLWRVSIVRRGDGP